MADKKVTGWFTMNGKHIPVFEGESKKDAVKRSISNGKAHQPVSKGHTEKKWKEFEDASRKAEIMHADIDAPKYRKKEIDKAREYDKAVEQKRKNGEIKSVKVNKKSVASKNEDIKAKQIAQAKEQAKKASGESLLTKEKETQLMGGYTPVKAPKDMDWVAKDVADSLKKRIKSRGENYNLTDDDIVEVFTGMNDDYDDWWSRSVNTKEKEKAFLDDMKVRLRKQGITVGKKSNEQTFKDTDGNLGGAKGTKYTLSELQSYWNREHKNDPVMSEYSSFSAWMKDTFGSQYR